MNVKHPEQTSVEMEGRLVVSVGEEEWGVTGIQVQLLSGGVETSWNQAVAMVAKSCECTENC